jgi:hypothetical protein
VFRSERVDRTDYYCNCCDFYASREKRTDRYHAIAGRQEMSAVEAQGVGCP